ncbi:type IV toxin-antitoxin system AbiEi family antitoxin domain-containing protein [Akkermansia glycaniphila]|uniref:Transcriptional regulator abiei antitoxin n=1 Tax=Akkermansia glycaniphila TaxID=1679444 RepID=A0A1C7PAZ5_9BACT|nr:hypothetical protein [Akkermansia glycaniphila]OCA02753.1 hypothetical protein AC781_08665 [Akkermansia glycaniphila]SEH99861.1 transcriptional regulator abiei antitoxin [Akkermansia glycaniphila]
MTIPTPVKEFFRNKGGVVRRGELLPTLMTARMLQKYMERGIIQRWGRGIYRLSDENLHGAPEMLMVARKYPMAVICLVSALSFHDMTTQIPHAIDIAIPYQRNVPRASYPLVRAFRFRDTIYEAGIEIHDMQGVPLKVYNKEKTLVDVFRFRNRLGMDVFLEALKMYTNNHLINLPLIHEYAALRGVTHTIMPYLETLV